MVGRRRIGPVVGGAVLAFKPARKGLSATSPSTKPSAGTNKPGPPIRPTSPSAPVAVTAHASSPAASPLVPCYTTPTPHEMRAAATSTAAALLAPRLTRSASRAPRLSSSRLPLRRVAAMAAAPSFFRPEEARSPPALEPPTPPLSKFKVALCQLSVTADKARNIAHARAAIEKAAADGAKLVLLPEIWNSPYSNDSFPEYAEDIESGGEAAPSFSMMSEVARSLQITLVGGSIPERSGNNLYNTCCVFGSDGKLKGKHRKIHLFDIDIPGKITFKESKTLTAGQNPTVLDTDVGRIGIGICYDIRFQELAMLYAARGAHLLCYPGAFNMTTGPLHWELLQRARATDNQLFVATCAPARDASAGYVAWGHSTLVGPFGEVIATTEHEEATVIAEIDYSLMEQRRQFLPLQYQRRGDLYQLVDVQRLGSQ